jgi:hypothetical protein
VIDGLRDWTERARRAQAAVTSPTLSVPQHDLAWPLGGWLRFVSGHPAGLEPIAGDVLGMASYSGPNGLRLVCTIDNTRQFGPLLHCSISHRRRDPFWDEIRTMREVFFPEDMDAMMVLPRKADYVNLHEHTFHVVQTPTAWGMR